MKERQKSYFESYGSVVLFRDDVEAIFNILKGVCSHVQLETEDHTFSDVDEWANQRAASYTSFEISGRMPFISIRFQRSEITLYAGTDSAPTRGALEQTKSVLRKCKRKCMWLMQPYWGALVFGAYIGPATVAVYREKWNDLWMPATALVVSIVWVALSWDLRRKKYSLIFPKFGSDVPHFWARNSDKIWLVIITAFLGTVLNWTIQRYSK